MDLMLGIIGPIYSGMVVMIGKAFIHFNTMIVEQFFIAAYIGIFC
jgi:hypothetical protein